MKYLLTQSLLNSWLYYMNYQGDDIEKVECEFVSILKRIKISDNQFLKRGRDFEFAIQYLCKVRHDPDFNHEEKNQMQEIADIVKEGTWQVKGYCDRTINGIDFLLYGICDVLAGPIIYDIKRVSRYEPGKYFNSPQHKMYFELFPGTTIFDYLISDGREVYIERYTRGNVECINSVISQFLSFLDSFLDYKNLYFNFWEAKK